MKLAQTEVSIGQIQGGNEFINPGGNPAGTFENFITRTIGLLTIVAAVWFVFLIITGGIGIVTSGGDKAALEGAKKRITSGAIGLAVTVVGLFVADFVTNQLLGVSILNPAGAFQGITP